MAQSVFRYNQRLLFLAVIGLALSGWLLYHHVEVNYGFQQGASFCDFSSLFNCTKVAQSPYSVVWGIPVATLGLLYYLTLILFIWLFSRGAEDAAPATAAALFLFCLLGLLPSVILALISLFILQSFCSMCAMLYVVSIVLCVLAARSPALKNRQQSLLALVQKFLGEELMPLLRKPSGMLFVLIIVGVSALLVFRAEQLLVTHYFQPRSDRLHAESTLKPIYEAWQQADVIPALLQEVQANKDPVTSKGAQDTQFVLTEFSDFQCPYCQRAASVLSDFDEKLLGALRIDFRHFPLDAACNELIPEGQGHDKACRAAYMTHCAGQQLPEKFWQMHDALFALEFWTETSLTALPEELTLDTTGFAECMESDSTKERIAKDIKLGVAAKVRGTPSFYLNAKPLPIQNLQALEPFLKYALRKKGL